MEREDGGGPAKTGQEYAEVNFVPNWIGHSKNSPKYRFIAIREPLRNPPLPGLEGQLGLPSIMEASEGGWYKVFGVVTNRDLDAGQLVWWSRQRCGKGEEVHSVLKEDLAGGRLPSGRFGANAAWWAITALAFNLNSAMKQLALGQEWVSRGLKAVRFRIISLPGRVTRHGRNLVINLSQGHPSYTVLAAAHPRPGPRAAGGLTRPLRAQRPLKPGPAGCREVVCGLSRPGIAAHPPLAPSYYPRITLHPLLPTSGLPANPSRQPYLTHPHSVASLGGGFGGGRLPQAG